MKKRRIFFNVANQQCTLHRFFLAKISVVDPNTLNLDPDPEPGFWPNLDPDPDPGFLY